MNPLEIVAVQPVVIGRVDAERSVAARCFDARIKALAAEAVITLGAHALKPGCIQRYLTIALKAAL